MPMLSTLGDERVHSDQEEWRGFAERMRHADDGAGKDSGMASGRTWCMTT